MRFLVVYSWNFWFHKFLNLLSNNRSTCLRGITSAVQHVGGMCWGSVTDKLKMRRRQEKHIRWVHLSLTALDASISSERQVTHSTLHGTHVSRDKSKSSVDLTYRRSAICFLGGSAFLTGSGLLAGSGLTGSGFFAGLEGPMKALNTPDDRSPALPGLALDGLRSMLRSVRDTTGAVSRTDVKTPEDRSPALAGLLLDGLRSVLPSVRGCA